MAITARFAADFSSFYSAVDKADAKLTDFTQGAGRVEKALSRMTDQFSGRRVIQEATLMEKAIQEIGGTSKLTEKELQRVSAAAGEAVEKLRAMGADVPAGLQKLAGASAQTAKGLEQTEKSATLASGAFGGMATKIGAVAAGMVSAEAVIGLTRAGIRTLTQFLLSSVDSFSSAEAASRKLEQALRSQSTITPQLVARYGELATQFQKTSVFSDDLVTDMQALLVQVGDVMPSQMEVALKASTDLAAGLGIDLQTATSLVAKAAAGHTETLGRYGITVSDAAIQTKGFDATLEAIESRFGGQASAQLETYAGKVQALANAWDNVKEVVGGALVGDAGFQKAFRDLTAGAQDVNIQTKELNATFQDFAATLIGSMSPSLASVFRWYESVAQAESQWLEIEKQGRKGFEDFIKAHQPANDAARILAAGMAESARQSKADEEAKKKHAAAVKQSQEALRKYNETVREVLESARPYADILAEIDGRVIEGVRYYAQKNVAVEKLATMYGLTTPQVEALNSQLKIESLVAQAASQQIGSLAEGVGMLHYEGQRLELPAAKIAKFGNVVSDTLSTHLPKSLGSKLFGVLESIPGTLASAFTGGGGFKGAFLSIGSQLGSTVGEGIGKGVAMLGKLGGPIGAAIGSLAGPLIGKLVGMFSSAEKQVNPVRQAFVDAAGGLATLNQRAAEAGVTLRAMLDAKNPEQYKRAIDELNAAFEFQSGAMRKLDDAVKKYGFSLEELGPALQRQALDKQAQELFQDFQVLTSAGIGVDTVIGKMGESIQAFVSDALRTGSEIPAAMAPMLKRMAEMGILTDQNGNVIADLESAGVKFAMTMSEGFQRMIDEVKKLTDAIARGLGLAIANVPNPEITGRVKWEVDAVPGGVDRTYENDWSAPVYPMANGGDFMVKRPTLFLAGESGAERATFTPVGDGGAAPMSDVDALRQEIAGLRQQQREQQTYFVSMFPRDLARAVRDERQKQTYRRAS